MGCDITNGDESIAIKSPSSHVLVANTTARKGNGFVVGTAGNGLPGSDQLTYDVKNVTFRDCAAVDTTFGQHVKAKFPQRGSLCDVTFENINIYQ